MSNVVPLLPIATPPCHDPEPRLALRCWGRRLARLLGCLLGVGAAFEALVLTLGLACGGAFLWIAPGAAYVGLAPTDIPGLVSFGSLPVQTRLAYAVTFALDTTPALAVLIDLRRVALAYADGVAFDLDGVKRLRRVGFCLAAYAVAPAVGHSLVLLAGRGIDLDYLHASSFLALLLAAVAVTLAEVTRIGHAVESDRDGFV